MTPIDPGRFTRAAVHNEAGEIELKLSAAGNWQLRIRAAEDRDWRLACSGDLEGGAAVPQAGLGDQPVRIGKVLFDRGTRRLSVDGTEVKLTAREYEVFAVLATQPQRIFTKRELTRELWGCERLSSSRTLESHVSRVRCALRRAGAAGFVINCHGVGYRLWESVETTHADNSLAQVRAA